MRARLAIVVSSAALAFLAGSTSSGERAVDWRGIPKGARRAADSLMATVARETRLPPRRSRGEINPIYLRCRRPAARFEVVWRTDTSSAPDPFAIVDRALVRSGWTLDQASRADGPDGTVYAFTRGKLLCVVEGLWDGGDDSDTTSTPDPTRSLLVDVGSAKRCRDRPVDD